MGYNELLREASTYLTKGEKVPEELLEKAIGKRPAKSDSASMDTLMEEMQEINAYRKKLNMFLEQACSLV